MFNNPRQAINAEAPGPPVIERAIPQTAAADDYGWDGGGSSKLNLAHLSLQDTRNTNSNNNERNQTPIIDPNDPDDPSQGRRHEVRNRSGSRDKAREKKRQARRKHRMEKKIQQDAAKTAAEYYGECHIEGVGIVAADKAAKESHRRYKKWWQGQTFTDEFHLSSLGDGLHVPRYNMHKPRASARKSHGLDNGQEDNVNPVQANPISLGMIGGRAHVVAAAINSSVIVPNQSGDIIDRSSGTRHPSPVDTTFREQRSTGPLDHVMSTTEELKQNKKRQRPMDGNSAPIPNKNTIDHSNVVSHYPKVHFPEDSKPSAIVSEPEGNEYDETLHATGSDFENEKIRRREVQRRGSSYSDYEDGEPLRPQSQRKRRPSDFYHEEVSRYRSSTKGEDIDSNAKDLEKQSINMTSIHPSLDRTAKRIDNAKLDVIRSLAVSGGDVTSKPFLRALEQLRNLYVMTGFDARKLNGGSSTSHEGNWFTLSRPHYNECLGTNSAGEYMYSLGRMSFDMFTPGNLVCSIGGIFNSIEIVEDKSTLRSIPNSLKEDVAKSDCVLRRYDIVTAFKVESSSPQFGPNSPNSSVHHPLRGTITTYGYVLPDPDTPNRLSVWFSGGKIEGNVEGKELEQWKNAFCGGKLRRHLSEKARVLAAKLLLGAIVPSKMEDDGHMEFRLTRPIGGHGSTYIDVVYMDENLRIVQGQRGSLFVFTRVSSSI